MPGTGIPQASADPRLDSLAGAAQWHAMPAAANPCPSCPNRKTLEVWWAAWRNGRGKRPGNQMFP